MFKIRKAAVFLLIGFLCISLAGCGRSRSSYRSKNQLKYETVAKNLLKALDGKDADGIEALFSPFAKEQDPELKEKVERLTKFLEGPVQAADLDGLYGEQEQHGEGSYTEVFGDFAIRTAKGYFWIYLEVMTDHEDSPDYREGIQKLYFYTGGEQMLLKESEGEIPSTYGIELFLDKTVDEEIRAIEGFPRRYTAREGEISLLAVKEFLNGSDDLKSFQETFGAPNATEEDPELNLGDLFYVLPAEKGVPQYLKITYLPEEQAVLQASIVDEFESVSSMWGELS